MIHDECGVGTFALEQMFNECVDQPRCRLWLFNFKIKLISFRSAIREINCGMETIQKKGSMEKDMSELGLPQPLAHLLGFKVVLFGELDALFGDAVEHWQPSKRRCKVNLNFAAILALGVIPK